LLIGLVHNLKQNLLKSLWKEYFCTQQKRDAAEAAGIAGVMVCVTVLMCVCLCSGSGGSVPAAGQHTETLQEALQNPDQTWTQQSPASRGTAEN